MPIINLPIKLALILRIAFIFVTGVTILSVRPNMAEAASNEELIRGFNMTVFGAEFAPFGIQSYYIRKFNGPVRFRIINLAKKDRTHQIRKFIGRLGASIHGLETKIVTSKARANFNIYVVDEKDYEKTARQKVFRRSTARVPGHCLVQSTFSINGILRSVAAVVSDGGEKLFRRCMIEEILQGLGALNEDASLQESMFNDQSKHTHFTRFDRILLNMLYDKRIKNGATRRSVEKILPQVLATAKKRVR